MGVASHAGGSFSPLAERPTPSRLWAWFGPRSHVAFLLLNRLMVPLLRAGAGPWMGTPATGYVLLLEVVGRRSGTTRRIPLSYLILDGSAWVLAGYGVRTQWYLNLRADPQVTVRLPGRTVRCCAEDVHDPGVRARVIPRLARVAGLAGFLIGCNPWTASDARILGLLDWIPLIRLSPGAEPLSAGPDDPGGLGWVWRQAIALAVVGIVLRSGFRALRALTHAAARPRAG